MAPGRNADGRAHRRVSSSTNARRPAQVLHPAACISCAHLTDFDQRSGTFPCCWLRLLAGRALMKLIEIVPHHRAHLYGTLVAKEASIRRGGRGTYVRVGRKTSNATRWKHKKFGGSVELKRGASEVISGKIRAATPENERKLLSSFLGFLDRHSGDQVATITIHYR